MIDELIEGLLYAVYNQSLEECRKRHNAAVNELKQKVAQSKRQKVSELTKNIKEIDSNINKVKYRMLIMDIPGQEKEKILQQTIDVFKEERKKLKLEKRKVSRKH